jgi:hypothetical protein
MPLKMKRLMYVSFAPGGFDMARNLAILETARRANLSSGVTGVLLVRDALYMQVLEGPKVPVDSTFAAIQRDRRHLGVTLLADYEVKARIFPGWQMGFYHMTAIEGIVSDVLIGNADEGLQRIVVQCSDKDAIASTLNGFLRCNASQLGQRAFQSA